MAAMLGDDVSKAGLGRASIRKNLWPGAVLIYQLDPAIGIYESTYSPMDEGLTLDKDQINRLLIETLGIR